MIINGEQTGISSFYSDGRGSYTKPEDEAGAKAYDAQIQAQNQLNSALTKQSELAKKASDMFASTKVSIPTNFGSGGVSGSKSGGSGGSSKESDAEKWADKINELNSSIETDRYYDANNAIKQLDNTMSSLKTSEEGLSGAELTKAKTQENEVITKQIQAYKNLQKVQEGERDEIKAKLAQYGILTDSTGQLINAQSKLASEQARVNALSGNDEASYNAKKTAIEQLKLMSENVKKYGDMVNSTIPDTIDKWNELATSMKKANEEAYNTFRDELVGDYLKDQQDKVDALKEEAKKADEDSLKSIEDEKTATISAYDAQIKSLQDKLNSLDDESASNEEKLKKLKAEKKLWEKDSSVFSKSKIADLDTKIAETEKTIAKDSLQKQIDDLNAKKQAESDAYDESKTALEKSNTDKESENEATYKDMLDEKKAYAKADEMISNKSQAEMIALLKKYDTSYKDIGKQLSASLTDPFITKIQAVEDAWTKLSEKIADGTSSTGGKTLSDGNSSSGGSFTAKNGDHVWIENASSDEIYADASHNNSKGTAWSNGVASADELIATGYENGFMQISDSNGNKLGWVENSKLKKFATGGRIGKVGSQGVPIIADSNEMIANASDTQKFDEMYNYIKNSGSLISGLSSQYSNIGNYTMPSIGTDLNSLTNGVTNNSSTDNSNSSSVSIPSLTIINQAGSEPVTYQTLDKFMTKWTKKQGSKYS